MGNQLVSVAPSQLFPVDYYFSDLPEIAYESNLGSTRFFKVARSRYKEGFAVVKVFAIPDDAKARDVKDDVNSAVKFHRQHINELREPLRSIPHCLPFQKCILTDRAGFLVRQYVKHNLYDRISTRPFLNSIERRWIAFQLLQCMNECHKLNICHGDIKLENIMMTSWNWVLLTDFASYKPTNLPKDNPADFSYFFDTSRRRICYIAPERFVKSLNSDALSGNTSASLVLSNEKDKKGLPVPSMDVFSLGCALTELFTEGHPPFDFSQLLEYCSGDYNPWKVIDMIDDANIRELVRSMLNRDPTKRLQLSEYLEQQKDKAFPEYFYSFLDDYIKDFSSMPIMSSDEKVHRLKRDINMIIDTICSQERRQNVSSKDFHSDGLVIIVTLVTSSLRSLKHCTAKLNALDVLRVMADYLASDIILDRILPYLIQLAGDDDPKVRVGVIQTLTECLAKVQTLPPSDSNIFPEYILPNLSHLAHDSAVIVRMAYAENIVSLAETALRFLEMTQVILCAQEYTDGSEFHHNQVSYDHELRTLQELVQQSVTVLLSDSVNAVKQTILERGIMRLCVFFGKQKGNDVLLSHMITYLNDKEDRHLRGSFFRAVVGVAAYVGWQCCPILKPLLQQGLTDTEEFVIARTLRSLQDLTQLGLIRKQMLYNLVTESVPLLLHPNLWIKQGAIGFACAVARCLNLADVQCSLIPLLNSYLKHNIVQVEKELVLLNAVQEPLPRSIFDYLVSLSTLRKFIESLKERKMMRSIARVGHPPSYREFDDQLKPVYLRLLSDGMNETVEEQILAMEDHLIKIHDKKSSSTELQHSIELNKGRIELSNLSFAPKVCSVLLSDVYNSYEKCLKVIQNKQPSKKKVSSLESPAITMNEEWQHMFGSAEVKNPPSPKLQSQMSDASSTSTQKSGLTGSDLNITIGLDQEALASEVLSFDSIPPSLNSLVDNSVKPNFCVSCQEELISLIEKKQYEFANDEVICEGCETIYKEDKPISKHSKVPAGSLVAHLHEHKGAINRVKHIPKTSLFATCSNDGTVKLWDCEKMEGRNIANRSRLTYSRLEAPVSCMTICNNMQSLAAASDNGQIHVFKIAAESKLPISTRILDPQEERCAVDLNYFDTGSQSVLAYATLYGSIVGWDLRSPGTAWKLESDPRYGLVTSFSIDSSHCWLVLGTASGNMIIWDLRFQLCITSISHPAKACIRNLMIHPNHQSAVLASVQGNNEVSMWDVETETRMLCLWASGSPPLSKSQRSEHSVHSMCWWSKDKECSMFTGGSDMRIRYWNFNKPESSTIIAGAANDPPSATVAFRSQVIEGTEVIQEQYTRPKQQNTYDPPRRYPEMPPTGHRDCISGLTIVPTPQTFLVSTSRDGVVKVWK